MPYPVPVNFPATSHSQSYETVDWLFNNWKYLFATSNWTYVDDDYLIRPDDYIITIDSSVAFRELILPSATENPGKVYHFENYSAGGNGYQVLNENLSTIISSAATNAGQCFMAVSGGKYGWFGRAAYPGYVL